MILDHIRNLKKYEYLHADIPKIVEFVNNTCLNTLPIGKHEIDGSDSFILIQQYDTKKSEEVKWESHRKYIDIQYILYGVEKMRYMPISQMEALSQYCEDKDVIFYKDVDWSINFEVMKDYYAVFLPADAHKPSCMVDEAKEVKKAIIKIPVI